MLVVDAIKNLKIKNLKINNSMRCYNRRIALCIGKIIIISICKNILMKLVEILLDMSHKKKYNKLKCDFNI